MSDLLRANEEADEEFVDDEEDVTTRTAFRAEQPLTRADALSKLEELLNKATAYTNFLEAQMINENNSEPAKRAKTTKLVQPKLVTGGTMKPYQLEGVRWLTGLWENGLNGILADDMGLGKTIQTIALLAHLRELKVYAWRILVVPLSTMTNWMAELQKWAPSVPAMQYHGDKEERVALRKRMAQIKKSEDKSRIPVLVTTYEVVCRDRRDLQVLNLDWKHLIVDEGHRLKNRHCRLIKELNMLVGTRDALNHGCSKLLLTGTPLQNDITELWSLLNFLLPQVFDNLRFFQDVFEFDDPLAAEREQNIVSKLHRILRPFMLRRLKTQVEQDLPPKLEVVVYCNMTDGQRELYEAIRQGELKSLLEQAGASASSYQNVIMQLRKAANHPYLHFDPTEASQVTDRSLVTCSGKFVVLDELLLSLHAKGHKTLIFSQFTKTIDLLDDYLRFLRPQWRYARLDGSTHFTERGDLMREFNDKASDTTVFLLSTRAGGVGINLCAADTVVIFDSDWNPHMDSQAQDRAHRIGQTKPVLVIRLVSTRSVELKIIARANSKRKLDRVVCSKHASATAITALTSDELRQMLNDDFSGLDVGAANARTIALLADRARMFDAGLPKNGEGYEVCDWKASSLVGEI